MLIGDMKIADDTKIIITTLKDVVDKSITVDVRIQGSHRQDKLILGTAYIVSIARALCEECRYDPKKLMEKVAVLLGPEGDDIIERQP